MSRVWRLDGGLIISDLGEWSQWYESCMVCRVKDAIHHCVLEWKHALADELISVHMYDHQRRIT